MDLYGAIRPTFWIPDFGAACFFTGAAFPFARWSLRVDPRTHHVDPPRASRLCARRATFYWHRS